jgi:L-ascorbate metabolism protein UlaG (beta-lactamase superfamily)
MDRHTTHLARHASFRFDSPGGKRVYVDPFHERKPKTPDNEKEPERVDIIAINTRPRRPRRRRHRGHSETAQACRDRSGTNSTTCCVSKHGIDEESARDPNKGGTIDVEGIKFSLTDANHSSSIGSGSSSSTPASPSAT